MASVDARGNSWAVTGLVIVGAGFIVALIANFNFEHGDSGLGISFGYLMIGFGTIITVVSWGIMALDLLRDIRHSTDRLLQSVRSYERRGKSQ